MSTLERKPETDDDRASWHNEQTCKGLKTFKAENRPVSHKPARNHWPRYEAKNQFPEMNATVKITRNVAATASSVTSLKLLPVSLFQKSDYRPPQKMIYRGARNIFPYCSRVYRQALIHPRNRITKKNKRTERKINMAAIRLP